jgi:NAD+ synthase
MNEGFSRQALDIDPAAATAAIVDKVRAQVGGVLRRRGLVVGLSGGIDSSVVAYLAVRALGKDKVLALFMPERDTSDDALRLGRLVASALGIESIIEDIAPALAGLRCYERQDAAIRQVFPEYASGHKFKITLPSILESERLNVFQLTVLGPHGQSRTTRMPLAAYLELVAATNFKQRVRKMLEYYHADRLNFAVAGTPNRLEYDQGFFVKQGDGMADVKPIAHLYKTQVYQLAYHLGVPTGVTARPPTTDTYSLPQTQEEFYFSLPAATMDKVLHAQNAGLDPEAAGELLGLEAEQVRRAYKDIDQKRMTTRYLHQRPLLVEPVTEIHFAENA